MNRAFIAMARFGYGAGPDESLNGAAGSDPQGWLDDQLRQPENPAAFDGLPSGADQAVALLDFRRQRRDAILARKADGNADDHGAAAMAADAANHARIRSVQQAYQAEVGARVNAAIASRTPFFERLVAFWGNHFTVSASQRPEVRPLAGAFEREAIRPHVTGRFHDMLLAATRHPAMGLFLDNAVSVGPNSPAGLRSGRGVNENLGRELMELHTLGVDGGYGEDDVRALARILTGWSIGRLVDDAPGQFRYFPMLHEPGDKVFLGRTIPEGGQEEGLTALAMLADHPSTARHVATKLDRHFIADDPPAPVVQHLAAVYMRSGGDLGAVTRALVASDEAWADFGAKVKTPYDFVVSAARALARPMETKAAVGSCAIMGQPVFGAPSPAGWPDDAASWSGPEAVMLRLQWAQAFAERSHDQNDPNALTRAVLMGMAGADLTQAVARAESRPMAMAMLLSSPMFQRR